MTTSRRVPLLIGLNMMVILPISVSAGQVPYAAAWPIAALAVALVAFGLPDDRGKR